MRAAGLMLIILGCATAADEPFTLRYGQTVRLASGPSITFENVEDSRCPRNTVCVWEGEVRVHLRVGDERVNIKVPGSATAAGYTIEVREVRPYPDDPPPPKSAYEATVVAEVR